MSVAHDRMALYKFDYYAPPIIGGALSDALSDVCLSCTSGLSREQRGLGRSTLAKRWPTSRVTRTPLSRSKGQRSRSPGRFTQRVRWLQRSAWERIRRGKVLLRCVCSAARLSCTAMCMCPTELRCYHLMSVDKLQWHYCRTLSTRATFTFDQSDPKSTPACSGMPPCHRARVPNLVTVFNRLIAPKVVSDRQTAAFPPCQSSAPRRCCIMDRKGGNGVLFSEGTCLPPPLFYFPLKCNHFHVVHDHLSANEHTYVLTHTQVIQTFRSSQLNVHFCVFFSV